jgi:hypothetical protein
MAQFATLAQLCLASIINHSNLEYSGSASLITHLASISGYKNEERHQVRQFFARIVHRQASRYGFKNVDEDYIVEYLVRQNRGDNLPWVASDLVNSAFENDDAQLLEFAINHVNQIYVLKTPFQRTADSMIQFVNECWINSRSTQNDRTQTCFILAINEPVLRKNILLHSLENYHGPLYEFFYKMACDHLQAHADYDFPKLDTGRIIRVREVREVLGLTLDPP